ncbi:mucin-2 [Triplophysa rosa]|uniref:mucin-2 n=1 Tax=Triplophysa rosa TaxID=992332 RepID=UPI002545D53C|nr:mucin-2 [Triplophysa rosa]
MKPDGVDVATVEPMEALNAGPEIEVVPAGGAQDQALPGTQTEAEPQPAEALSANDKTGKEKSADPKTKTKAPTKTKTSTAGTKTSTTGTKTSTTSSRPTTAQSRLTNGTQKTQANGVAKKTTTAGLEKKTLTSAAPKKTLGSTAVPTTRTSVKTTEKKPAAAPANGVKKTPAASASSLKSNPKTSAPAPRPASASTTKPISTASPKPPVSKTTRPAGTTPAARSSPATPKPATPTAASKTTSASRPTTATPKTPSTTAKPSPAKTTAPPAGRTPTAKTTTPVKKDVSKQPSTPAAKKPSASPLTRPAPAKTTKPDTPKSATAAKPESASKKPPTSSKAVDAKTSKPKENKAAPSKEISASAKTTSKSSAKTSSPKKAVGSSTPMPVKRGPKTTQPADATEGQKEDILPIVAAVAAPVAAAAAVVSMTTSEEAPEHSATPSVPAASEEAPEASPAVCEVKADVTASALEKAPEDTEMPRVPPTCDETPEDTVTPVILAFDEMTEDTVPPVIPPASDERPEDTATPVISPASEETLEEKVTPALYLVSDETPDDTATPFIPSASDELLEEKVTPARHPSDETLEETAASVLHPASEEPQAFDEILEDRVTSFISSASDEMLEEKTTPVLHPSSDEMLEETVTSALHTGFEEPQAFDEMLEDRVTSFITSVSDEMLEETVTHVLHPASDEMLKETVTSSLPPDSEEALEDTFTPIPHPTSYETLKDTVTPVLHPASVEALEESVAPVISASEEEEHVHPQDIPQSMDLSKDDSAVSQLAATVDLVSLNEPVSAVSPLGTTVLSPPSSPTGSAPLLEMHGPAETWSQSLYPSTMTPDEQEQEDEDGVQDVIQMSSFAAENIIQGFDLLSCTGADPFRSQAPVSPCQEKEEAVEKAEEEINEDVDEEEDEEREIDRVQAVSQTVIDNDCIKGVADFVSSDWGMMQSDDRNISYAYEREETSPFNTENSCTDKETSDIFLNEQPFQGPPGIDSYCDEDEDEEDDEKEEEHENTEQYHEQHKDNEFVEKDVEMVCSRMAESGICSNDRDDDEDYGGEDYREEAHLSLDNKGHAVDAPSMTKTEAWGHSNPFSEPWVQSAFIVSESNPIDTRSEEPDTPPKSPVESFLHINPPLIETSEPQPDVQEQTKSAFPVESGILAAPAIGMSQSSTLSGTALAAHSSSETSTPEELQDYDSSSGVESRSDKQQTPVPAMQMDMDQDLGIHLERGDGEEEEAETLPADEVLGEGLTAPASVPSSPSSSGDEASDTEGELQINDPDVAVDESAAIPHNLVSLEEDEEVPGQMGEEDGDTPQSANSVASYGFDCSNSNAHSTAESCGKSPGIFSLENEEQLPEEFKDPSFIKELTLPAASAYSDDLLGGPVDLLPISEPKERDAGFDEHYMMCRKTEPTAMEELDPESPMHLSPQHGDDSDGQPPYYSTICDKTDNFLAGNV